MDLLQTLLVYMSLVFATSVQVAPEPVETPSPVDYFSAFNQIITPSPAPTPVPTIDITPNPAYKTLQMGERGDGVRELQERLQMFGYYEGEIDGAYGNQTRQAVEHFQYAHGLAADGIAGRHTLTVLYESPEIRLPEGTKPTPAPTEVVKLSVALTPPPVEETVFLPVLTATPVPTATPNPTEVPLPVEELIDYTVLMDGRTLSLQVYQQGETIYLPVLKLLSEAGVNVISSSSLEMDEYAFASGMSLIRFTHTENQQGEPAELQVYRNDEPELVPERRLYQADDVLYMPMASFESMTGFRCVLDAEQKTITVETIIQ